MRISDWSSDVCSSDLAVTIRFGSRPTRWMLAASSGIDMRGVLRTLRPVGRDTSRDRGPGIRFLLGSAASSSTAGAALAVAWMAWASVSSEERRVGKDGVSTWRVKWEPDHQKKKKNNHGGDQEN